MIPILVAILGVGVIIAAIWGGKYGNDVDTTDRDSGNPWG